MTIPAPHLKGRKSSTFPQVPVDQGVVRCIVKNERDFSLLADLRERIRSNHYRIPWWCKRRFVSSCPNTIIVKTDKCIGQPVIDGYRRIFASGLLKHGNWIRELIYSPSNVPFLLLRYLAPKGPPWDRRSGHGDSISAKRTAGTRETGSGPSHPIHV